METLGTAQRMGRSAYARMQSDTIHNLLQKNDRAGFSPFIKRPVWKLWHTQSLNSNPPPSALHFIYSYYII